MARVFTAIMPGVGSLTTTPFFQLSTPATTAIEIRRIELTQESSTTTAQTVVVLSRRSTASTLPTAVTPAPVVDGDPASLLTGSTTTNAYGVATVTGTIGNILLREGFNVLNGWLYLPVPDERIVVKPSAFVNLHFPNTPPAVTWEALITFAELA